MKTANYVFRVNILPLRNITYVQATSVQFAGTASFSAVKGNKRTDEMGPSIDNVHVDNISKTKP